MALPKFIIYRALFELGWDVTYGPTFLYNRPDLYAQDRQYQMMHSVSAYNRMPGFKQRLDVSGIGKYTGTAIQIINDGVTWIDNIVQQLEIKKELEDDLANIVEFREQSSK